MDYKHPHQPVLLKEVISLLMTDLNGVYLDGTIGYGGHSEEILNTISQKGFLIGMDLDPYALKYTKVRLSKIRQNYSLHRRNYREYSQLLQKLGIEKLNGILLDLGSSSSQINTEHRGFSFQKNSPLNMRFNPNDKPNAGEYLKQVDLDEIEQIIKKYGEERNYKKIALNIFNATRKNEMKTTFDLKKAVEKCIHPRFANKSLARVFQAIRIKINNELESLEEALTNSIEWLKKGGRIAIISFHSLEDRIVKNFFVNESKTCTCPKKAPICTCKTIPSLKILKRKIIRPSKDELISNPRSRSAKLRIAERI